MSITLTQMRRSKHFPVCAQLEKLQATSKQVPKQANDFRTRREILKRNQDDDHRTRQEETTEPSDTQRRLIAVALLTLARTVDVVYD